MELVKRHLENIDISYLNINSECKSGLVEFEYKDILYIGNVSDLSIEKKLEFLTNYHFSEKTPFEWSENDWVNHLFTENWQDYTDQILLEFPQIWELDEERMWNENNTLSLANNIIQFKKPFELFEGLAEGSELEVVTDGQSTIASPINNPSPWVMQIGLVIKDQIECKGKEKEITEVNEFQFEGKKWIKEIYFYFEGMSVIFKEEVENPYPNNCTLCSDFVSDKDLYCTACTQIEE